MRVYHMIIAIGGHKRINKIGPIVFRKKENKEFLGAFEYAM